MTATQGFVASGLLLFFGLGALLASGQMQPKSQVVRVGSFVLGSILLVLGVLWLLLSIAAHRGEG